MQFDQKPVLVETQLVAKPGRKLGIIGPAASGKTLLAKLWCGLLRPSVGEVWTLGEPVSQLNERQLTAVRSKIGMLFQNYALFDFLTVLGNVSFALARKGGKSEAEIEQLAMARLKAVGLAGSEHKFPAQLSGGMKKRVGIARATVAAPELMIYDEPTAGLDPVTTQKVYDLLAADHAATGGTVIAISSDVLPLARFVDDIAFVYQGKVAWHGSAANIIDCEDDRVRQFVRGDAEGPLAQRGYSSMPEKSQ